MQRKQNIDAIGAFWLVAFSVTLGLNQTIVKVMNGALQPVFNAGLRSVLALGILCLWMIWRHRAWEMERSAVPWALLVGALFTGEFLCLFIALDLTSVARASVMFYTMPVWLALMAHLFVPGDRLTGQKLLGQGFAVLGIAWALLDRGGSTAGSLTGDFLALMAAFCWASIALSTKVSPFSRVSPEIQLMWQVTVSAMVLVPLSFLFGPLVRDFAPVHLWGVAFQALVVGVGFLGWFALLKVYPASGAASFAFLSPVIGVLSGWLILGERVGLSVWGALVLVAIGLTLINRAPKTG